MGSHLVAHNKAAVSCKDNHGRLPIHLAFHQKASNISLNPTMKESLFMDSNRYEEMIDLKRSLVYLCSIAPETVLVEDDLGINAIEYALEREVDSKIFYQLESLLQEHTEVAFNTL